MSKKVAYCKTCGNQCKKHTRTYCSIACRSLDPEVGRKISSSKSGVAQSAEHVAKRLASIDQVAKEKKRKRTMRRKYGVTNWGATAQHKELLSKIHTGRKCPRSAEHQDRIVQSKMRNGTHLHTAASRAKIARTMKAHYANPDLDRSVYVSKPKQGVTGYYKGLYYRSSYERAFLRFCDHYGIDVEGAATKRFAVPYVDANEKHRKYYPDFYLPEFNVVVEIKPASMLMHSSNIEKFDAAATHLENYIVLCEVDGYLKRKTWDLFYYGEVMEWVA